MGNTVERQGFVGNGFVRPFGLDVEDSGHRFVVALLVLGMRSVFHLFQVELKVLVCVRFNSG